MLSLPTVIFHQIYEILQVFSNSSLENISIGFKIYNVNINTAVIYRYIKNILYPYIQSQRS